MDESDLKRSLIKSLRADGGEGFRIEDRYRIGTPDCLMLPPKLPGFLIEAKILKGAKLVCTPSQRHFLERFHKPPLFLAAIIGFSERRGALYIGKAEQPLDTCRYVPRPRALLSTEWWICELLGKFYRDECRKG